MNIEDVRCVKSRFLCRLIGDVTSSLVEIPEHLQTNRRKGQERPFRAVVLVTGPDCTQLRPGDIIISHRYGCAKAWDGETEADVVYFGDENEIRISGVIGRAWNNPSRQGPAYEWHSPHNIQPLNDRLLIVDAATEERTAGGLYIPESARKKASRGYVLRKGPGLLKDGEREPIDFTEEDVVVFPAGAGEELPNGLRLVRAAEVFGKVAIPELARKALKHATNILDAVDDSGITNLDDDATESTVVLGVDYAE